MERITYNGEININGKEEPISKETLNLLLEEIHKINDEKTNYVQKLTKKIIMTNLGFLVRNKKRLIQAEFIPKNSKIVQYQFDENTNVEKLYSTIVIQEDVITDINFHQLAAIYLLATEKGLYNEYKLNTEIEKSGILIR